MKATLLLLAVVSLLQVGVSRAQTGEELLASKGCLG